MPILFQGNANIYLQGENALTPIRTTCDKITYYIGDRKTRLLVRDFRHEPVNAAHMILRGKKDLEFADSFNQAANVKVILKDQKKVEINLHDVEDNGDYPTLWLGVLNDNLMPNYDTEWEFLRPVNDQSTAIAVLLSQGVQS